MDIWVEVPSPVEAVLPRRIVVPFARPLVLGRVEGVDVRLSLTAVNRRHCEVGRDGCGAWVRDMGSRNGTYVKERRIGYVPHRLSPNDRIRLTEFVIPVGWDFEADPYWLLWEAGIVRSLAQRVRGGGDHAAMPILADALEDAGCAEAGILEHLRGPGPHVRECWVIAALLGGPAGGRFSPGGMGA